MNDFIFYLRLGFEHILDINAYDHLLFLVAMSLPFVFKQSRLLLLLVTAFTIGHTLSLWAASAGIIRFSSNWIEFLIPMTILLTALHTLYWNNSLERKPSLSFFVLAGFFGIIHGLGFSGYFSMVFQQKSIGFPLLYFTLGIELAQLVVVAFVAVLNSILSNIFRVSKRDRLLVGSSIIIGILVPILIASTKAL